ncbi:hypothetical protein FACS1894103_6600 [Campylobacterota bacterium]|nr:hypothetical protein FACS1894103_6600 [Campylobacterota bacterium]
MGLKKKIFGTVGGAGIGGFIGSSMGIAALGTAISGLLPVAVVGAVIGYGIGHILSESDEKDGDDDAKSAKETK